MDGVLTVPVVRTTYEAGRGNSLLALFHLDNEVIKYWLNIGTTEFIDFWSSRTGRPIPSCRDQALEIANKGGLLPTKAVKFRRDGRWPKVVQTEVGTFSDEIKTFVEDATELFGPLTIIRVIA